MTLEEYKKEVDKNIESLFNKANNDEKELLYIMINTINDLCKEKQELIDYLKVSIKKTNDISEELDDIFYMGKLVAYKEILSKIEKE